MAEVKPIQSKFIVYEHASGETIFVKRDAITSFTPKYVQKGLYRVFVTVGKESFAINQFGTVAEAKEWIIKQIELIDE